MSTFSRGETRRTGQRVGRRWQPGRLLVIPLLVLTAVPGSFPVTAQRATATVHVDALALDGQLIHAVVPGTTIHLTVTVHWWGSSSGPAPLLQFHLPDGLAKPEVILTQRSQCVADTPITRCTLTVRQPGIALVDLQTHVAATLPPGVLVTEATLTVSGVLLAQDTAALQVAGGSTPSGQSAPPRRVQPARSAAPSADKTSGGAEQARPARRPRPAPTHRAAPPTAMSTTTRPVPQPTAPSIAPTTPPSTTPTASPLAKTAIPTPATARPVTPTIPVTVLPTTPHMPVDDMDGASLHVRVILPANVRNMPHTTGSQVLTVVGADTTVTLEAQLPDRTWYRVVTPQGVRGWMHHTLLDIRPALLANVAPATGDLMIGGTALTPTTVPTVSEVTGMSATNGVIVTELPGDVGGDGDGTTTQPRATVAVPLVLRACYDRNQNAACDVDEGIAGVTAYVTDAESGRLLGQALTDAGGRAQLTVRAPAQGQVVVSVPDFGSSQTAGVSTPQLQPVIIKQLAPLPALLP